MAHEPGAGDATPLVKFEFHHSRKEGISYDDFVRFVKETWIPAARPIMKRYGVVRSAMTFQPPEKREALREQLRAAGIGQGWEVSDFDVSTSYYAADVKDLFAMQADPEWQEKVAKVQEPWVAMAPGFLVIGQETVFLDA